MLVQKIFRVYSEKILKIIYDFQGIGISISQEAEVRLLRSLLDTKITAPVVFDVGANKGGYAQNILNIFPKHTQLHCFEPSKEAFAHLRGCLTGQVVKVNMGLSDHVGTVQLYSDEPGSTLASLKKRRLDHFNISFNQTEDVSVTTLDVYASQSGVTRIDILKIDAEGHELSILGGGRGLFEQDRIGIVQFEFGGCNIDSRTFFQDFYYFFKEYSFSLFRMCRNGKLYPLVGYSELYEVPIYQNLIALKGVK